MIISIKIIAPLILLIILVGCNEYEPEIVFEKPIKGKLVNLSSRLGNSFKVIRENDTIEYKISFDDISNINYITTSDSDTIFVGTVTKRNELFLLNRKLPNEKVIIHAIKITDSTITGLETEWIQNQIIKNQIDSGYYQKIISDTINNITISPKKKDGKQIFRFLIEQLKPEKLITSNQDLIEEKNESVIGSIDYKLIDKVYPNPFIDKITIELKNKAPYVITINDISGNRVKTTKLNTNHFEVYLPNLSKGYYFLKVLNTSTDESESFKLIKN